MNSENKAPIKFTFSGHDTFHCRHLWLKKGYDFIKNGKKFSDIDAVVELGVGKNMVAGIHFWMKAFGIINSEGELTEFAIYLFDDEKGKDPYIEDEATLWLLHYQLITQNIATTYNLVFNDFRREKIEFTKENFIAYIVRKGEEFNLPTINKNTLQKDFDVLTKTYIRSEIQSKDKEDTLSGLLTDLNIIQEEKRRINDKTEVFFSVTADERIEIPDEVLLYGILDYDNFDKSISFYTIEQEKNQVGSVFAINRTGLLNKMESITANPKYKKYGIIFNDHAGIKELQFKIKPNKFEILNNYYGN